jgi:putative FmdB family regulatory protein
VPTYEYACAACGHRLEHFQAMSDAPLTKCPKCAKKKLKRLIGAGAGVIFKGSGFYTTDYRSASYDDAKKADSAAPAKPETCGKPACDTGGCQSAPPPPTKKTKKK